MIDTVATRGLDHLVVAVDSLDGAIERYRALGFTTTPKAMHPWGTGNALVQLDRSFFELLAVEDPSKIAVAGSGEFSFGDFNRRFLTRREGLSMLVFSSADAASDGARWQEAGLETYPPFHFSRTARLPDGREVTVAFSLAFVTDPAMPWAAWFVCQQHHPEHFWKPQFQRHENGAKALARVLMTAADPQRHAAFLSALFAEARLVEVADGVGLELPSGRVEVVTPDEALAQVPGFDPSRLEEDGPHFVAATVVVDDARQVARLLDARGIPAETRANGLWLRAPHACGLALEFRAA